MTLSKRLKMKFEGWWMVQRIVRPMKASWEGGEKDEEERLQEGKDEDEDEEDEGTF